MILENPEGRMPTLVILMMNCAPIPGIDSVLSLTMNMAYSSSAYCASSCDRLSRVLGSLPLSPKGIYFSLSMCRDMSKLIYFSLKAELGEH